ncbi:FAD-dependent oxidoreductase [Sphingobium sufflavum]|uniref:FAD-dependent oxidoreductase n=1 Tax=Sphingobium sufflavum TaxID=1129547 RepID=UPI001F2A96B8|nr:FAD-dependent oxidoreductase [Sphingobium sufflavum]MCE7797227.1 FAD-dependent oxidoreductase [Sphingobium sufflavum]
MTKETGNHEPGQMNRRGVFRGAAMLGGVGAAGLFTPSGPFRALAAEPVQTPGAINPGATTALAEEAKSIVRWTGTTPPEWVVPRGETDHDVVVVGAGHSGVSISYWLRRRGIGRVLTIDQAEPGQAGIWRNVGRMRQLNTPKTLPGPARDNAALGFRAWYETLYGTGAFDALERVPRLAWADYLAWFQQTTETQVGYRTRLLDIEPVGSVLRLHLETEGVRRVVTTRKIVLASGYLGGGGPNVPDFVRTLPTRFWSHTGTPFALAPLAGKVVGVLGAGASAFDAAGAALEAGAAQVHLFSRKDFINYRTGSTPPPSTSGSPYPAPLGLSYNLPEEVRWRNQLLRNRAVSSVMSDEVIRAVSSDRFYLHLNSSWSNVAVGSNGKVSVKTETAPYQFDFVIAGTGYRTDVSTRPELARFHQSISLWGDRYKPAPGEENPIGNYYPYLGSGFQFQPKQGVSADFLRNIHVFNPSGRLSFDAAVSDISSAALYPILVEAIARDFFAEGVDLGASKRVLNAVPPQRPDPSLYQRAIRS